MTTVTALGFPEFWGGMGRPPRLPRFAEWVSIRRHKRAGRRDGRHFLPAVAPGAVQPAHWQQINSAFQAAAQSRWTELVTVVAEDRIELAKLLPEIERAEKRHARAEQALAVHLANPPVIERRHGENRMPDDLVKRRRAREYDGITALLTESRTRKLNYWYQLGQGREGLEKAMTGQLRIAQSTIKEQHRLASLGVDLYLKGAQRTHHDPEALLREAHRFILPLPAWVVIDDLGEFLKLIEENEDNA